jgi:hypothetical protein
MDSGMFPALIASQIRRDVRLVELSCQRMCPARLTNYCISRDAQDSLNALIQQRGDPMAVERYAIDSGRHASSLQAKVVDVGLAVR